MKCLSYNDIIEVVDELFDSLCSRYEDDLNKSIRESAFVFYSVQKMYGKYHKVIFIRG